MNYVERRRFLWVLFLAGLALLAAVAASATTLVRLEFGAMAKQAVAIARLRCLGAESKWDHNEIWTETRFEVVQTEKGNLAGIISVLVPGGRVDHLLARVEGAPEFRAGEDVYLFLWGPAGGPYRVLGWGQGTFRISRNGHSGTETVTQDSAEQAVFDPRVNEFRSEGIRNLPVASFQTKLRLAVASESN